MNRFVVVAAIVWLFVDTAFAQVGGAVIENKTLLVTYHGDSRTFSVKDKASGKVFLKDGRWDGVVGDAGVEKVKDATFGTGTAIVVPCADGEERRLELYENLPFVLVRGKLCHSRKTAEGQSVKDVKAIDLTSFALDLGKPVDQLRTLGTAGLTSPDKNPGSYLFLTLAEPATRNGVVAGWLTNDRAAGVVFSKVEKGLVEFRANLEYGHLRLGEGKSAALETLAIGYFDDARLGEEQFADAIAKHYRIKLHPQVAGYCTWYSDAHGAASDEKAIVELGRAVAKELKPFGMSVVQIDDEWQDGGTYNGPRRGFDRVKPNGPYPHGMKPVADELQKLGLTAGVWFLPFARNHQDPEYKDRQHWFMKRENGKPYETEWGGTSLDLTNPEVVGHLAKLIQTIHGWGYNYFKMDGLWTGSATEQIYVNDGYRADNVGNNAPFHDLQKTNVEAYRDGLKLLRIAAGPDVFFSGCNVSQNMRTLGGTIGLVDSMRIGPDNGQGWNDYRKEIEKNECLSIITGPIRGTRLYFLNGRTWWNDPDPSYVRNSIPLNHARLITSWVALSGQFYLNSDWIPGLAPERLDIIKRTIPAHGATARPIDYFDSPLPSLWLVTDTRGLNRRDVLGLFNWESSPKTFKCSATKAGLETGKRYYAFDFWANKPVASFQDQFEIEVPGQSCRVIAVRSAEDHPVLVSTSRHVTQGMVDVADEKWNASGTLSGTSRVVGGDAYELRFAGLNDGGHWKPESLLLSEEDAKAGVTIEVKPNSEDGWLRVVIRSKDSRDVRWTVQFAGDGK
jgi:hypothetical protein